jgi:hypothetical protein
LGPQGPKGDKDDPGPAGGNGGSTDGFISSSTPDTGTQTQVSVPGDATSDTSYLLTGVVSIENETSGQVQVICKLNRDGVLSFDSTSLTIALAGFLGFVSNATLLGSVAVGAGTVAAIKIACTTLTGAPLPTGTTVRLSTLSAIRLGSLTIQ